MAKRLQVILQDPEYREIQRMARAQHLSIAAWVRQALAAARRREPLGDAVRKLAVVRAASRQAFPTADIDRTLEEIEAGYGAADSR
jgi:predicted double-glycine peptidase